MTDSGKNTELELESKMFFIQGKNAQRPSQIQKTAAAANQGAVGQKRTVCTMVRAEQRRKQDYWRGLEHLQQKRLQGADETLHLLS